MSFFSLSISFLRRFTGTALFLLPAYAAAAPLSLKDTISYAIQHSPQLDDAIRQAELLTLAHKNATAAFLPTLDFNGSLGKRGTQPSVGENPTSSTANLALAENLYDNNESLDAYRLAKLKDQQGQVQALETRDQYFLTIAQSFYQFTLTRKLLEIQQTQFDLLQKQYNLVSEGYQAGLRTRKDYLRFRTQVARSEIDLRTAKISLATTRQDLLQQIGAPILNDPGFDFAAEDTAPVVAPLPRLDLTTHREYTIAELDAKANAITTLQEKRKNWPQVYLAGNANYGATDFVGAESYYNQPDFLNTGIPYSTKPNLNWSVAITLKYNILDWGVRSRNVEIAETNQALAANKQSENLLQVRDNLEKLYYTYGLDSDNYRSSLELLDLEKKNLEMITREYHDGRVQYLDYITSLSDLSDAQSRLFTALYAVKKDLLSYRYNQGTLYEALFK